MERKNEGIKRTEGKLTFYIWSGKNNGGVRLMKQCLQGT